MWVARRGLGEGFCELFGDAGFSGDAEGSVVEEFEEHGGGFGGDDEVVLWSSGVLEEGRHHIDEDAGFGTWYCECVSGIEVESGHGVDFEPVFVGSEVESDGIEYLFPEPDGGYEDFAEVEFADDVVEYCGDCLF